MTHLSRAEGGWTPRSNAPPSAVSFMSDVELMLWSGYVDKLAASVIAVFESRGIGCILLKGPAIAQWLYADGPTRPYGDADVMVAPRDWIRAQALLAGLGFAKELAPLEHPGMESFASESWVRGLDNIDLHCALWGFGAPPSRVWQRISAQTEPLELEGQIVRVLSPSCRTALLATHAAKHGDGQSCLDLERAVATLAIETWREAAELAVELDAVPAFVAGMRLVSGGGELVGELGLPDIPMAEASLRAWRVPMALGLEQLSRTPGIASKLAVVWHELFPNPAFMRWWTPLARTNRVGLLTSYVWRLIWVARHALPAYRAWRRARNTGAVG